MNADEVRKKHDEYLFATSNYYEEPITMVEGKGVRLRDIDGKSYLDCFGGILTVSVGHCNDAVNTAVKAQIDRLGHVSTLYPTLPIVTLAEKLAQLTPGALKKCFFTTSGTEANDSAVILAQAHTGNQELIALRHGYSGRSLLGQSLTAQGKYRAVPSQVAAIKHAVAPYCYRCPFGLQPESCGTRCAYDIEEVIRTTTTGAIAGFLAEPIQGVGGFITPPPEYFQIAVEIIRKYGGVFICDEVQTGFGRTGGKWWGCDQYGVTPDIMTMAKGVANGMPLGVTICTPAIADAFKAASISTFGANPITATAANATIGVIESENLVDRSKTLGDHLRAGLEDLKRSFPKIVGDVRGMGLMQGMEFVVDETKRDRTPDPAATARFFEETKKRGVLVGRGGLYANVIRIAPPMTIDKGEINDALAVFREALIAMHAS